VSLKAEQGDDGGIADAEVVEAAMRAGEVMVVSTDGLFDDELEWIVQMGVALEFSVECTGVH
jgi:hypothetical protein